MRDVRLLVSIAVLALGACEGPTLSIEVEFADQAQREASVAVEITLRVGGCEDGELLWQSLVREDEQPQDVPAALMRGRAYCIQAVARDDACAVIASDASESADAPVGVVTLTLRAGSGAPGGCEGGACVDGVCEQSCEVDGAPCMSSGMPGVCHAGACCAGCWDGERCLDGMPAAELDAGELFTCMRSIDGRIACWGANGQGELGDGSRGGVTGPSWRAEGRLLDVPPGPRFTSLTVGIASGYAVDEDGHLWVWGWNDHGQLGLGAAEIGENALSPVMLAHPTGGAWARAMAPHVHEDGSALHACAFARDGELWCWGANDDGQVDPTQPAGARDAIVATPRRVEGSFSEVALAQRATCGVVMDGTRIACWGSNARGELGAGDTTPRDGIVTTSLGTEVGRAVELAAGIAGFCARTDADRVFCWGDGESTNLPTATMSPVRGIAEAVALAEPVAGSTESVRLAIGRAHGAMLTGGAPYVWGANPDGRLALGPDEIGMIHAPGPSGAIPGPPAAVREISVGSYHSCARLDDGTLACAGSNNFGQVGVPVTRESEPDWQRFCPCAGCLP